MGVVRGVQTPIHTSQTHRMGPPKSASGLGSRTGKEPWVFHLNGDGVRRVTSSPLEQPSSQKPMGL